MLSLPKPGFMKVEFWYKNIDKILNIVLETKNKDERKRKRKLPKDKENEEVTKFFIIRLKQSKFIQQQGKYR